MKTAQAMIVVGALLAASANSAHAASNPDPLLFANDSGDNYLFVANNVLGFEVFDQYAGRFGFYFPGAPGTLIEIFGAEDQGGAQVAAIDFAVGGSFDVDASDVQAAFAGTTDPGPIGFWYSAFDAATDTTYTFFSDPALNGGVDYFGTFTLLSDPFINALTFEAPSLGTFSLTVLQGTLAPSLLAVPVPAALPLMLGALGIGASMSRRRQPAP